MSWYNKPDKLFFLIWIQEGESICDGRMIHVSQFRKIPFLKDVEYYHTHLSEKKYLPMLRWSTSIYNYPKKKKEGVKYPARSAVGVQCVVVRTVDPLYNNTVCLQCGLWIPFLPTADGSAHCAYTVATMGWNHCGLQWALYLHCSDFVILGYTQWSYSAQRQWAYSGYDYSGPTVHDNSGPTVGLQWVYSAN